MAIDDQDIDQVLTDIELDLFEDDPELVQSFGALWHPSLAGPEPAPAMSAETRHTLARARVIVIAVLVSMVMPGIVLGEWAPLQALAALTVGTALVVGSFVAMLRVTSRRGAPSRSIRPGRASRGQQF